MASNLPVIWFVFFLLCHWPRIIIRHTHRGQIIRHLRIKVTTGGRGILLAFTSIRCLTRLEATIFSSRTAQGTIQILTSIAVDLHGNGHGDDGLGVDPDYAFGGHGRGDHDGGRFDHGSGRLEPDDRPRGRRGHGGRGSGDHMVQPLTSLDLGWTWTVIVIEADLNLLGIAGGRNQA